MRGRWLWVGACAALVVLGLAWFVVPYMSDTPPEGVVRVAVQPAAPPVAPSTASPEAAMPPPAAMSSDPNDLYMRVRGETHDAAWGPRAEAALLASLRTVPKVGNGARLEAHCAATVCEVSGVAAPREPAAVVQQTMDALRRLIDGGELRAKGFVSVTSQLGTAHSENEFVLYFRRSDAH